MANALLGAVTAAALASELASRDASISGLQASKADASALTAYALQSALATLGEVLLEPTLTTLGNFLVRSNSQSSVALASFTAGGFQLEDLGGLPRQTLADSELCLGGLTC